MRATPHPLDNLHELLDSSLSRSTSHVRSVVSAERTLTAKGKLRISGPDGHFPHGKRHFGTARNAAKARRLADRSELPAYFEDFHGADTFDRDNDSRSDKADER